MSFKKLLLLFCLFIGGCSKNKPKNASASFNKKVTSNFQSKLDTASKLHQEYLHVSDLKQKKNILKKIQNTILNIENRAFSEDSLLMFTKKYILELADNNELDSAEIEIKKIEEKYLSDSLSIGILNYLKGYVLDYRGDYSKSIEQYQKSISYLAPIIHRSGLYLSKAYNDQAYVYAEVNIHSEALKFYQKAYEVAWNHFPNDYPNLASISYNYLSELDNYGDFETAKIIQEQTANHFENYITNKSKLSKIEEFDMFSIFYLGCIRSFKTPMRVANVPIYLKKIQQLFEKAPDEISLEYNNRLSYAYDHAGYAFLAAKEYPEAEIAFKNMQKNAKNPQTLMKAKSNFAAYYLQTKQYALAEKAYKTTISESKFAKDDINLLMLQSALAWMQSKQGKNKMAINTIEKLWLEYLPKNKKLEELRLVDLGMANSTRWMFILNTTSEIFGKNIDQYNPEKKRLAIAKNMGLLATEMFEEYYKKEAFNKELNQINNHSREVLMQIINSLSFKEKVEILNRLENNSSQHLWKNYLFKNQEYLLSDKTLLEERNKLLIKKINEKNPSKTELKIAKINQQIEEKTPRLDDNKFHIISLENIQAKLAPNLGLIRYLEANDNVFGFLISKDTINIQKLGKTQTLDSLSQLLYTELSNLGSQYGLHASKLYNLLIRPFEAHKLNSLSIIAEKSLLNIPFEVLNDKQTVPIGLQKAISYNHSLHFERSTHANKTKINKLAAFAPIYTGENGLLKLENTALELEKIAQSMPIKSYVGNNASKLNFIETLNKYKIQHLAMHAIIDSNDYEKSSLVFAENQKMQFKEIYALNIPAELVTLSACNTGIGVYHSGEGLMSLSKALFFAGTKSVVHSLWRVPDEETAEIMGQFYKNLAEGKPKNIALQEAKINFVNNNPLKQHPYFWAGFVFSGDRSPIEKESESKTLIYILIFVALSVAVYFWRKRSKSVADLRQGF